MASTLTALASTFESAVGLPEVTHRGMSLKQTQQYLALPEVPTRIANVNVPAGTRIQVDRVAAQPEFGTPIIGGVQY